MRAKKRFLIFLFMFIVVLWSVGIAGLILWQTSYSKNAQVQNTFASFPKITTSPTISTTEKSRFGDLLQ